MSKPARIVRLDQIEPISGPGTLTWRPVRLTLGISAFGCNAYSAAEAGHDVVEPHREDPKLAHQELYFVARGRATFTIDGEMHDAPAGTYVFVPDPTSHRYAVAAEPNTTVLSFGGPPTFQPSAWEWTFQARPLFQSDPGRARALLEEGLRQHPDSSSIRYGLACVSAAQGRLDEALDRLRGAIDLRPEIAATAREEDALKPLHHRAAFQALVGG